MLSAPEPLIDRHQLQSLVSGEPSLDEWLQRRALQNQLSNASRTFVVAEAEEVVGFYCLAAGAVGHDQAPRAVRRNQPDPVPVVVLGRLAIHQARQQRGLGTALLRDAILRTLRAAQSTGIVALLVHALSEPAKRFYLSRGFIESPVQSMTLCLMLATAEKALRDAPAKKLERGKGR